MKGKRCLAACLRVRWQACCWAWPRTAGWLAAAAFSCWLSAQSASRGDLFTFDTVEEFEESFSQKAPGEKYGWSEHPGVGGDPGRVDVRLGGVGPLVFDRPVTWDTWESISAQAYFYYDAENAPSRGGPLASVTTRSWPAPGYSSPYVGVSVEARPSHLRSALLVLKTTLFSGWQYSSPFGLSMSGWYRLEGTWALGEGAEIECAARLFWQGIDGSETGRQIASFRGTLVDQYVASHSSVFVAVNAGPVAVPYLDNIWIIPEPSASALAVLGGMALCWGLCGFQRSRPPNGP